MKKILLDNSSRSKLVNMFFFFLIQSNFYLPASLRSACGIATIATISFPVSLVSSSHSYFRRIEWKEIDLGSRLP